MAIQKTLAVLFDLLQFDRSRHCVIHIYLGNHMEKYQNQGGTTINPTLFCSWRFSLSVWLVIYTCS